MCEIKCRPFRMNRLSQLVIRLRCMFGPILKWQVILSARAMENVENPAKHFLIN